MALTRGVVSKTHKFVLENKTWLVRVPDIYDSIGTVVGITELTGDPPNGSERTSVKEALKTGKLVRLRVSYMENSKRRVSSILCLRTKIADALDDLPDKTMDGKPIKSAYQPTRRRLG